MVALGALNALGTLLALDALGAGLALLALLALRDGELEQRVRRGPHVRHGGALAGGKRRHLAHGDGSGPALAALLALGYAEVQDGVAVPVVGHGHGCDVVRGGDRAYRDRRLVALDALGALDALVALRAALALVSLVALVAALTLDALLALRALDALLALGAGPALGDAEVERHGVGVQVLRRGDGRGVAGRELGHGADGDGGCQAVLAALAPLAALALLASVSLGALGALGALLALRALRALRDDEPERDPAVLALGGVDLGVAACGARLGRHVAHGERLPVGSPGHLEVQRHARGVHARGHLCGASGLDRVGLADPDLGRPSVAPAGEPQLEDDGVLVAHVLGVCLVGGGDDLEGAHGQRGAGAGLAGLAVLALGAADVADLGPCEHAGLHLVEPAERPGLGVDVQVPDGPVERGLAGARGDACPLEARPAVAVRVGRGLVGLVHHDAHERVGLVRGARLEPRPVGVVGLGELEVEPVGPLVAQAVEPLEVDVPPMDNLEVSAVGGRYARDYLRAAVVVRHTFLLTLPRRRRGRGPC